MHCDLSRPLSLVGLQTSVTRVHCIDAACLFPNILQKISHKIRFHSTKPSSTENKNINL